MKNLASALIIFGYCMAGQGVVIALKQCSTGEVSSYSQLVAGVMWPAVFTSWILVKPVCKQ